MILAERSALSHDSTNQGWHKSQRYIQDQKSAAKVSANCEDVLSGGVYELLVQPAL
jgi:hypothetical protein